MFILCCHLQNTCLHRLLNKHAYWSGQVKQSHVRSWPKTIPSFLQGSTDQANSNIQMCSDVVYNTPGSGKCLLWNYQGTVYLSAVRHFHICRGLHRHFSKQLSLRLFLILQAIRRHQANFCPRRKCLPITIQLLEKIRHLLSKQPSFTNITLRAMCCLAFLRVREFTTFKEGLYKPSCHLSLHDISADS